jgi:hypothetical protein
MPFYLVFLYIQKTRLGEAVEGQFAKPGIE